MNDPRYRGPSRPATHASFRDSGRDQTEREPEFEEEYLDRVSRDPRAERGAGERRPSRSSRPPGMNPGGLPTRSGRDGAPERPSRSGRQGESRDQRGGPRSDAAWEAPTRPRSGPDWGREAPTRSSDPDWGREPSARPDMERRPRPRPRSRPDWEQEPSPRQGAERGPGKPPRGAGRRQEKKRRSREPLDPAAKKRRRLRYLALLGLMVFAGIAGLCLNYGVIALAVPFLLLGMTSAGAFIYF